MAITGALPCLDPSGGTVKLAKLVARIERGANAFEALALAADAPHGFRKGTKGVSERDAYAALPAAVDALIGALETVALIVGIYGDEALSETQRVVLAGLAEYRPVAAMVADGWTQNEGGAWCAPLGSEDTYAE